MLTVYGITIIYTFVLWTLLGYTLRSSYLSEVRRRSLMIWGGYGFASNFIILSAYYVTLPLEWVPSFVAFLIITLIVTFLSLILGLLYIPIGYVSWLNRFNIYKNFITIITFFLIIEIIRPYIFTLATWGAGSTIGAHGSSWAIGSTLASTPFLIFAHFGGVFTLNLVLIYCMGLVVYPFQNKVKIYGVILLLVLFIFSHLLYTPKNNLTLNFGVVQTDFPHVEEGKSINEEYRERVQKIIHPALLGISTTSNPEMIVLPEDLRYLDLQSVVERSELRKRFPDALIIDGATRFSGDGRKNVSVIYDTKTDTSFTRDKGFMFPFGEYVPYFIRPFIKLAVGKKKLLDYQSVREYVSGVPSHGIKTRKGSIGVLICSELTSHSAINSLKNSKPDVVIVQSSLTWTHANPYYIMNHIFSLKILAVMLGKPVISVTNSAPSIMLDTYGDVISFEKTGLFTQNYLLTGNTIRKVR